MGWGLRFGKVIEIHPETNTVDVFLLSGGGVVLGAQIVASLAGTSCGVFELPALKTVKRGEEGKVTGFGGNSMSFPNLYQFENNSGLNPDLEDPTTQYAYAILAMADEATQKDTALCLGFVFPFRNQLLFDAKAVDKADVPDYVKKAVKKLVGGFLHRTNSDVYWTVDADGNMEWAHPNGSFFRIAETPTEEEDGAIHVDLSKANAKAKKEGKDTNMAWNTQLSPNAKKKVYAHLEVVTEKGIVVFHVDKTTGDIVIKTPKDPANAAKDTNKVTIIAGGDAILQSVAGDVTVQSVKGQVLVEAQSQVTVKTDSAKKNSILLAPNAGQLDNLLLYKKVADKFNSHKHTCAKEGQKCSAPDKQIEDSDATSVTRAG